MAGLRPDLAEAVRGRLFARLPETIRCAYRKDYERYQFLPKAKATKYDEICLDWECSKSAVSIDLDKPDSLLRLRMAPAPPNLVVVNKENGHAQAFWLLDRFVNTSFLKATRFHRDISRDITSALDGDRNYNHVYVHSPWSRIYTTYCLTDHWYSLAELREAFPAQKRVRFHAAPGSVGRNDYVFRGGNREGKKWVREGRDPDEPGFEDDLEAFMTELADEAEAIFPKSHRYTRHELLGSLRSNMRYVRAYEPAARSDRDRKREKRGSVERVSYTSLADSRRADILRLKADGFPVRLIAESIGCTEREVYRLQKVGPSPEGLSAPQGILSRPEASQETTQAANAQAKAPEGEVDSSGSCALEAPSPVLQAVLSTFSSEKTSAPEIEKNPEIEHSDLLPGERLADFRWTTARNVDLHGCPGRFYRLRDFLIEQNQAKAKAASAASKAVPQPAPSPSAVEPVESVLEPAEVLAAGLARRSPAAGRVFAESRSKVLSRPIARGRVDRDRPNRSP
jgi:hypothetical protein